ncbi:MAG: tRNA-(ms[2]io[6]A)-hydroxylase [Porticoccaceae bacterium]
MSKTIQLRYMTPGSWSKTVMENFDSFLIDHAAAEKKASGMAMSMALHYRDKTRLVSEMVDLCIEELQHFRECVRLIHDRGLQLLPDEKDPYVNAMRDFQRQGKEEGLLDRLIVAGIVESRGCERFGLVENALPEGPMKDFYAAIARSEDKHQGLFLDLAEEYFAGNVVDQRLSELLDLEAELVASLPHRAALH